MASSGSSDGAGPAGICAPERIISSRSSGTVVPYFALISGIGATPPAVSTPACRRPWYRKLSSFMRDSFYIFVQERHRPLEAVDRVFDLREAVPFVRVEMVLHHAAAAANRLRHLVRLLFR